MNLKMYRFLRICQRQISTQNVGGNASHLKKGPLGLAGIMLGGTVLYLANNDSAKNDAGKKPRMYTLKELNQMVENGRIVVAYKGSLYDMTDFTGHPGGVGRLQMAAGNDLAVYWQVYTQHNRGHVTEHMKPYKIGQVSQSDMTSITAQTHFDASVYASNPEDYPDLLVNTRFPYNAEARLRQLTDSFVTPIGRHFVRNHCAVPDIDPDDYFLTITGEGVNETTFSLDDLKTKFDKVDVTTVIQCNGNRREDFHYADGKTPAFGPPHWVAGAIGCSTWSGPRLRDVLKASGKLVFNTILFNNHARSFLL